MNGFKRIIGVNDVYIRGNEIIITGCPKEEDDEQLHHNCDGMGCNSIEHILLRGQFRFLEKGYDGEKQEEKVG